MQKWTLLLSGARELRLVEVKKLNNWEFSSVRISPSQTQRLQRAYLWLSEGNGLKQLGHLISVSVHMDVVYVYSEEKIHCHKDFFGSL